MMRGKKWEKDGRTRGKKQKKDEEEAQELRKKDCGSFWRLGDVFT